MALFLLLALIQPQTFTFQSQGRTVEGYLAFPAQPKALILYFHRSIEDRSAVLVWGELFAKDGYAVAGYTADPDLDASQTAADALKSLRQQKRFVSTPVIAMGASLGTAAASQLFGADQSIKGMILIVPPSASVCDSFKQAGNRPVFLIQAQNDDVAGSNAKIIRACLPKTGTAFLLPSAGHRFPPSAVSFQIQKWLTTTLR